MLKESPLCLKFILKTIQNEYRKIFLFTLNLFLEYIYWFCNILIKLLHLFNLFLYFFVEIWSAIHSCCKVKKWFYSLLMTNYVTINLFLDLPIHLSSLNVILLYEQLNSYILIFRWNFTFYLQSHRRTRLFFILMSKICGLQVARQYRVSPLTASNDPSTLSANCACPQAVLNKRINFDVVRFNYSNL